MDVSILLPSHGRPDRLRDCLSNLQTTLTGTRYTVETIVILDQIDADSQRAINRMPVGVILMESEPISTSVQKWNTGYRASCGEWVVLAADDLFFLPCWLEAALDTDNDGFIGLWDGHTPIDTWATHYMLRRDVIERFMGGYFIWPEYKSWYFDWEVKEVMKRHGIRYFVAQDAVAEHLHPAWGKAQVDPTYELGAACHAEDHALYSRRAALGFPMEEAQLLHERVKA